LSEFLASIDAYKGMLEAARQLRDRTKEAEALNQIGFGFFSAHEFEKALNYAEQAKAIALEIDSKKVLAASLFVFGNVDLRVW
jgi:hypothetical protein